MDKKDQRKSWKTSFFLVLLFVGSIGWGGELPEGLDAPWAQLAGFGDRIDPQCLERVTRDLVSRSPLLPLASLLQADSPENPSDAKELFARAVLAASSTWPILNGDAQCLTLWPAEEMLQPWIQSQSASSTGRTALIDTLLTAWGTPREDLAWGPILADSLRKRIPLQDAWGLAILAVQRQRLGIKRIVLPEPHPLLMLAESALFRIRHDPQGAKAALELLHALLKKNPYDPGILVASARGLVQTGQPALAADLLARAFLIDPELRIQLASATDVGPLASEKRFPDVRPAESDPDLTRVELSWAWQGPDQKIDETFVLSCADGLLTENTSKRRIPAALINALWQDIEQAPVASRSGALTRRLTHTDDEPEILVRIERPRGRVAWLYSSSNDPDMTPINAIGRGRLRIIENPDVAHRLRMLREWLGCRAVPVVANVSFPGKEIPLVAEPTGSRLETAFREALGLPLGTAAAAAFQQQGDLTDLPPDLRKVRAGTCVRHEATRLVGSEAHIDRYYFTASGTAFVGDRSLTFHRRQRGGTSSWFFGSPERFMAAASTLERHLTRLVGSQGIELEIFPAIGTYDAHEQPVFIDLLESVRTLALTDSPPDALGGEIAPMAFRVSFTEDRLQITGAYLPGNETILLTAWDGLNRRPAGDMGLLATWLGLPEIPPHIDFCDLAEGVLHLEFNQEMPVVEIAKMVPIIKDHRFHVEWEEKITPRRMTIRPEDGEIVMILRPGQPVGYFARRAPK